MLGSVPQRRRGRLADKQIGASYSAFTLGEPLWGTLGLATNLQCAIGVACMAAALAGKWRSTIWRCISVKNQSAIEYGNFGDVAKFYLSRPPYAHRLISMLSSFAKSCQTPSTVADIGAGTGALTILLADMGWICRAVEPDGRMLEVGKSITSGRNDIEWVQSSAEATTLRSADFSWVCVGNSYHWMKREAALREFHRILRPGGIISVIFNLSDFDADDFQARIEEEIRRRAPDIKRARPPIEAAMEKLEEDLDSSGLFESCVRLTARHIVEMSITNYLASWNTSHDLRSQMSTEEWSDLLAFIEDASKKRGQLSLVFKTSAWTAEKRHSG
ncbi:class I SAM-dependent methyltransferase [Sinorhizobium terangae]|uniref:class I SAM-dependent methyltransferase n=1 Tax=Sinorhizobium terangae TaxID=110322 RepID=UPI0024B14D7E|nr:class I SAM-dependent methyltransferase [Sinorhizobium terangae]WFU51755.1 class I SAM-dependent methyltransferase [Sinorhizobium terangae]